MTDNEKRAHDLAIAVLPYGIQAVKRQCKDGKIDGVDVYALYLETYKHFLDLLNADFPL